MVSRFHKLVAMGGSMSPCIPSGSRLLVERVSSGSIQKGDVLCFIGQDGNGVAHRVIRIENARQGKVYVVRGDAQEGVECVPEAAVLYVVTRVCHRRFSYNLNGRFGAVVARVALAESVTAAAAKIFVLKAWDTYRLIRMATRHLP